MTKIFESPDGGNTVYQRDMGKLEKELYWSKFPRHWKSRWYEWEDILKISDDHPALKDAIEKAEMIYQLVKDEK